MSSLKSAAEIIQTTSIGSTDIAPILGISPFGDPWTVWAQKRGLIEIEETSAMHLGKLLEPVVAQLFSEHTNFIVEPSAGRVYSKERPWQSCTPDYFIPMKEKDLILECKTASPHHANQWDPNVDNEDGVPDYYVVQVAWQLSTLELELAYVAVLIGCSQFRVYRIQRDPVLEEILLDAGERFWREHVMTGLEPPIGGSDHARNYLRRLHPKEREKTRRATTEEISCLMEYGTLKSHLKRIEVRKQELENILKQAIGGAEGLTWPNGRITWKRTKDRFQTNWQELAESQLIGFSDDEKHALIGAHSEVRQGTRRLYFKSDYYQGDEDDAG